MSMDADKFLQVYQKRERFFKEVKPINDGTELAVVVEDFLNTYCDDKIDEFIDNIIMFTHRTLQQKYFGLLLKSIEKFAEKTHYDGRNKCSVETAKKIVELMQENNLPTRMPLI